MPRPQNSQTQVKNIGASKTINKYLTILWRPGIKGSILKIYSLTTNQTLTQCVILVAKKDVITNPIDFSLFTLWLEFQ